MLANTRLPFCLVFAIALGVPSVAQQSGDQATVEKLLAVLQTGNDGAKREAVEQIGNLGSKAKNAVPALLQVMNQNRGKPLEATAMVALGKIGPEADAALTALHQVAMPRHPNARGSGNRLRRHREDRRVDAGNHTQHSSEQPWPSRLFRR